MLKKLIFGLLFVISLAVEAVAQEVVVEEQQISSQDLETLMTEADLDTIEQLKQEEFDFNTKDSLGNTPLFYLLTKNKNLDVAQKAIEYGADVNASAGNGMIPLNITTSKANEMQLQIMMMKVMGLDVANPEIQEELQKNLFYEMNRMIDMAKMLLAAGADVNKVSALGSPLTNAVTNNWNYDIIELFIKAGADLNWQDDKGRTPLFYAKAGGNDDVVKLLLESGANPDIKDVSGKTYLEVEVAKVESVL